MGLGKFSILEDFILTLSSFFEYFLVNSPKCIHTYMFKPLFENVANLKSYIKNISLFSSHQRETLSDIYPYIYICIYTHICMYVCIQLSWTFT